MRIDNPISDNAIITGSFTGSFKGDGSQLTGITAEWDGSHTGDASITGDLTVGNLITAGVVDGVDVSDLKSSFDIDSAKLAGIEAGATGDQSGAEIKTAYEAEADTNAFTDAEKSKLTALEAGATGDQTGAEIKALYEGEADTNTFTDAASAKLAGIEAGATGDQTAAEIKSAYESNADTNVFDDAAVSKLAGIAAGATNDTTELTSLDGRVSSVEGDVSAILSGSQADKDSFAEIVSLINSVDTANDQAFAGYVTSNNAAVAANTSDIADNTSDITTNATAIAANTSKLAGIESGATGDQTGAEIKALYEAEPNAFTDAQFSKLAGIESGATGDQSATEIKTAYESNSNTNAFTDSEKSKLAGIESGATNDTTQLSSLDSRVAVNETDISSLDGRVTSVEGDVSAILASSTADKDSFAEIVSLINSVDTANDTAFGGYVTSNNAAVATINSKLNGIEAGATGDQSAAEIKTAYESNSNTNAFTDAASAKLAGIEAGATGDQSAAEILTALKTVDGAGSGLDADLLDGQSAAYYATATALAANTSKLNGIEAGATADQTPAQILTAIKTVDGAGSGLDADLLDGQSAAYYATAASVSTNSTNIATNAAAIATKATPADVTTAVNNLINGAGTAYNTLKELGDAIIANDSDIATILTNQSGKLAKASNLSDLTNVSTARTNLGLGSAATTNSSAYATAAQGGKADTAFVWGNHASAGYLTSYTDTNTTYSAGSGLGLSGTTFSHSDTSAQGSVNNSGRTYIQDITLDGFGHVTGINSATETVVNTDTNTTYSAGNGLSLSGTTFSMSGAFTGNFTATGDITAYSDSRLKKDVKTIEGALDKTKALRGVEFTRIADDHKSIGVIAQELEAVLPQLVLTDDEGMKSVNYAQITGLLIEAVKELSAKVDELSK